MVPQVAPAFLQRHLQSWTQSPALQYLQVPEHLPQLQSPTEPQVASALAQRQAQSSTHLLFTQSSQRPLQAPQLQPWRRPHWAPALVQISGQLRQTPATQLPLASQPQSALQVAQVSLGLQVPSPHLTTGPRGLPPQRPATQDWPAGQVPQVPPQKSGPQFRPVQRGLQQKKIPASGPQTQD
jgi:hypothetical protein